jgi:hypothetical protein
VSQAKRITASNSVQGAQPLSQELSLANTQNATKPTDPANAQQRSVVHEIEHRKFATQPNLLAGAKI